MKIHWHGHATQPPKFGGERSWAAGLSYWQKDRTGYLPPNPLYSTCSLTSSTTLPHLLPSSIPPHNLVCFFFQLVARFDVHRVFVSCVQITAHFSRSKSHRDSRYSSPFSFFSLCLSTFCFPVQSLLHSVVSRDGHSLFFSSHFLFTCRNRILIPFLLFSYLLVGTDKIIAVLCKH